MQIERNISPYIVFSEDSILNALRKISENKKRTVFTVSSSGVLEGAITDGDFRRWLLAQDSIDLNRPANLVSNKNITFVEETEDHGLIRGMFSDKVLFIPILDKYRHLVAVAADRKEPIRIGRFEIAENSPTFVIAEIGINHNGSFELAQKLVDDAVDAGADCAKFQMRHMKSLYSNSGDHNDASEDLGSQYTLDLLSRFQLSGEDMIRIFDYCKAKGVIPLCTPWDLNSLAALEEYGIEAYKVASADLTNHQLLTAMARTGKPIICSTGMSKENEIVEAVEVFRKYGSPYVLLHCNSTYPAPFKDVNLNYLDRLKEIGDCPVGYSGHERGFAVVLAAVAKGATVVEKHFTVDRGMEGNDHKVSLLPSEFKDMVRRIREVEESLGSRLEREPTQGELMNRETLAKSLIINKALRKGEIITEDMVDVRSPGKGLQPNRLKDLLGRKATHDFKAGDFFFPSDLRDDMVEARPYKFKRPWGPPVRFHDYRTLMAKSNPDFIEFHLSYKDMEVDLKKFFDRKYDLDFVVHSPDLFPGDHIMNLASEDREWRKRSIKELQRVIDITRSLKPHFKPKEKTPIVASVGGFTKDAHVPASKLPLLYELIADSLSQLDQEGVEILPQTLPPFPWYFGGQLYLNIFVTPDDTLEFCRKYGRRLCMDISHSKLACNHYKLSFQDMVRKLAPHTAHLHIVDAKGIDGEGLQIGEGEVDFKALAEDLERLCPKASFIPEIWQGHKNEGEGFWIALERLEKWF
ncbi:MAG: N-acetylneuraminate synthase family protein [Fibrobacteria bacterium]